MNSYVALLRGINVGGRNSLPMRELVDLLQGMGLQDIRTYIQSGNVVFQSEPINVADLSDRMRVAINESHGFAPQVIVLELAELETAISSNPFPEAEAEPKTLHLYFLASTPKDPDLDALERVKRDSEQFALTGMVFYLHAPDGIGRSKLAERVERSIGVPVTARNWRTVSKIMAMARD
jgi:uncharacterized protein (DUF1697 family)